MKLFVKFLPSKRYWLSSLADPAPTQIQTVSQLPAIAEVANTGDSGLSKHKLLPGQWQKQVAAYESKWVTKRLFPQKVLIGAEEVIAKLLYEQTASRDFEPVTLGETLQKRDHEKNPKFL